MIRCCGSIEAKKLFSDGFIVKAVVFNRSSLIKVVFLVNLACSANTRFVSVQVPARRQSRRTIRSRKLIWGHLHILHRCLRHAHRHTRTHFPFWLIHASLHLHHHLYLWSWTHAFSLHRARSTHTLHHNIIIQRNLPLLFLSEQIQTITSRKTTLTPYSTRNKHKKICDCNPTTTNNSRNNNYPNLCCVL